MSEREVLRDLLAKNGDSAMVMASRKSLAGCLDALERAEAERDQARAERDRYAQECSRLTTEANRLRFGLLALFDAHPDWRDEIVDDAIAAALGSSVGTEQETR